MVIRDYQPVGELLYFWHNQSLQDPQNPVNIPRYNRFYTLYNLNDYTNTQF